MDRQKTEEEHEEEVNMLKVLIVDDDINVTACLSTLIPWKETGCALAGSAVNGQEGYELAIKLKPDIIICDIIMPVMDGAMLCQKIYETMSDVTFLFLSAYQDFTAAQLGLKYRVKDYILKPIDRNKIRYITELLTDIRKKSANDDFYERIINDPDLEREIVNALEARDFFYFETLFSRIAEDMSSSYMEIGFSRSVINRLVSILFDWTRNSGNRIEDSREGMLARLREIKFKMDLVAFARDSYLVALKPRTDIRSTYYEKLAHQVRKYVSEHCCEPDLTAQSVAEQFNYSRDYLARIFSQYCGQNLSTYLIQARMQCAADLLTHSNLTINEIADQTGFMRSNYFARVFRKYYQLSPLAYRQRHTDEESRKLG